MLSVKEIIENCPDREIREVLQAAQMYHGLKAGLNFAEQRFDRIPDEHKQSAIAYVKKAIQMGER